MDAAAGKVQRSVQNKWVRRGGAGLLLLFLVIGSGFVYEAIASWMAKDQYPPPGRLVDAGGYRLHLLAQGSGGPVIVLEAGSGESSLSWRDIPGQLDDFAAVVSYDRGGYAWSDPALTPRTGENIVKELHAALEQAGLPGPYILVGHSLGGLYARLFADTYRSDTVGLVLVDAKPEHFDREAQSILAQETAQAQPSATVKKWMKRSGALRLFQNELLAGLVPEPDRERFVSVVASPSYFDAVEEEARLSAAAEDAVHGQQLGSMPVRVIARGIPQDLSSFGISAEGNRRLEEMWQQGQREMLRMSTDSELITAEHSGHYVIHDEPGLVVDTIRRLWEEVSGRVGER